MSKQRQYPELRSIFDKNRDVMKMLKAEKGLSDGDISFRAIYNKDGRKIADCKDNPSMSAFTSVINGRYNVCHPDSITIIWLLTDTDEKLFEQTFPIIHKTSESSMNRVVEQNPTTALPQVNEFKGFGEAEVNQIVEKRINDLRRIEEYDRMKEEHQQLKQKLSELQQTNEELEKDKAAKETTENYMRIVGMALPGLAKFFGGTSLLSMLAGTEEQEPSSTVGGLNQEPKDEREEMIGLLYDFMMSDLNQQEVASLYLLMMEIQKDKSQLQQLLQHITKAH